LRDRQEIAPFFAEFTEQDPIGRIHAQRQLGAVIGQTADLRQVGVGHRQRHAHHQNQAQQPGKQGAAHPRCATQGAARPYRQGLAAG